MSKNGCENGLTCAKVRKLQFIQLSAVQIHSLSFKEREFFTYKDFAIFQKNKIQGSESVDGLELKGRSIV